MGTPPDKIVDWALIRVVNLISLMVIVTALGYQSNQSTTVNTSLGSQSILLSFLQISPITYRASISFSGQYLSLYLYLYQYLIMKTANTVYKHIFSNTSMNMSNRLHTYSTLLSLKLYSGL